MLSFSLSFCFLLSDSFCHGVRDCDANVKAAIPRSLGLMNKVESAYLSYL